MNRNSKINSLFRFQDEDEGRLRIADERAAAGNASTGPAAGSAPPRRPASGNRLDASIVKLRERQLLLKREQACTY